MQPDVAALGVRVGDGRSAVAWTPSRNSSTVYVSIAPNALHPTEERYVTFGTDAEGRVLAVSYALRGNSIRIISARKATPREPAQYEDKRI